MTLKTGIKADENSDLNHRNKLHKKNITTILYDNVCEKDQISCERQLCG